MTVISGPQEEGFALCTDEVLDPNFILILLHFLSLFMVMTINFCRIGYPFCY